MFVITSRQFLLDDCIHKSTRNRKRNNNNDNNDNNKRELNCK